MAARRCSAVFYTIVSFLPVPDNLHQLPSFHSPGPIPDSISNLAALQELVLSENAFSGTENSRFPAIAVFFPPHHRPELVS
jgi:hypothetical protein